MRKKSRGGTGLIELMIFGVLVLVVGIVLAIVTGLNSISAYFSPAAPTERPISLAGRLPTPAPTVTRTPVVEPTAVATTEQPRPTPAPAVPTGQVVLTSNLRTDPRVADDTRQAILCPSDLVEYTAQRMVDDLIWYRVRVIQLADDCNPRRAPVGTEGWASSIVLSAPSNPVVTAP
jgi:hypothetical protein